MRERRVGKSRAGELEGEGGSLCLHQAQAPSAHLGPRLALSEESQAVQGSVRRAAGTSSVLVAGGAGRPQRETEGHQRRVLLQRAPAEEARAGAREGASSAAET